MPETYSKNKTADIKKVQEETKKQHPHRLESAESNNRQRKPQQQKQKIFSLKKLPILNNIGENSFPEKYGTHC